MERAPPRVRIERVSGLAKTADPFQTKAPPPVPAGEGEEERVWIESHPHKHDFTTNVRLLVVTPRNGANTMTDETTTSDALGAVTVAGVDVTQERLEWALGIMSKTDPRAWGGIAVPAGYRPDLAAFGPPSGEGEPTPEQQLYAAMTRQDGTGAIFRNMLKAGHREPRAEPSRERPSGSPVARLLSAGFPRVVAVRASAGAKAPAKVAEWAQGHKGAGTPWLWLVSQDAEEGTRALAQAATLAKAPHTMYTEAPDLCAQVDAANQYGEGGKWDTMRTFETCGLLMLGNLGGERPTARALDTLAHVLRARHDAMLPTAIASAKGLREWLEPYARADQAAARELARSVVDALCGWETDEAAARKRLETHIVRLDS